MKGQLKLPLGNDLLRQFVQCKYKVKHKDLENYLQRMGTKAC